MAFRDKSIRRKVHVHSTANLSDQSAAIEVNRQKQLLAFSSLSKIQLHLDSLGQFKMLSITRRTWREIRRKQDYAILLSQHTKANDLKCYSICL